MQEEQLIIVLGGRQRQMRLIPIRALDQTETEWIKVADTKHCIVFSPNAISKSLVRMTGRDTDDK